MRTLINYLRSCFCKHEFELIKEISCFSNETNKMPTYIRRTYFCKKCGYAKQIKL